MSFTCMFLVHESLPTYPNIEEPKWIPRQQDAHSLDGTRPPGGGGGKLDFDIRILFDSF